MSILDMRAVRAFRRAMGKESRADAMLEGVYSADITVAAQVSTAITVSIQLKDKKGEEINFAAGVTIGIFADAARAAFNTQDYTSIAAGTDGAVLETVADKLLFAVSEPDGDIDIVLTETGAGTVYLGVLLADGTWAMSAAVTHA